MKKTVSMVVLITVFSLLFSSCSLLQKRKINAKRIQAVFEDYKYDEVDIDDIVDGYEDYASTSVIGNDFNDGIYATTTSSREVEYVFEDYNGMNLFANNFDYDRHMEQATWFVRMDENYSSCNILTAVYIQFDSNEHAIDYLSDFADSLDDSRGNGFDRSRQTENEYDENSSFSNMESDSGEDNNLKYVLLTYEFDYYDYHYNYYMGIYLEDSNVFIIFGTDCSSTKCERDIEDICELLELVSPTDL